MDSDVLFPKTIETPKENDFQALFWLENLKHHPVKSFAQAMKGVYDIPQSQLPQPIIKGDRPSITIPEKEYKVGLDKCKNNLHGRMLWPKGSSPLTVVVLRDKLYRIWPDVKNWGCPIVGKREDFVFFSDIEYENLSELSSHCRKIGSVV
ncbi:unnamed protein product [Vicia faba]|uniref:Uncharacterized protein n=1 Tax=Vicia faba TaxID=3906 RepID=A0AAV1AFZ4_VICFA|nr:unnamed protein product [Vicia faba]